MIVKIAIATSRDFITGQERCHYGAGSYRGKAGAEGMTAKRRKDLSKRLRRDPGKIFYLAD
jgi:hypothetical protein